MQKIAFFLVALIFSFVIVSFYIYPQQAKAAETIVGLGIMGDSFSDEYRADDNRGGDFASTTFNWDELLQRFRGINIGAWGTRTSPRRTGYEYNWALSGDTAHDVITQGQHTGLASQVRQGKVSHVILIVGANDFAIWNGTYAAVYNGTLSGAALQQKINSIANDITLATDTILAAGPVKMVVATLADRGLAANFQQTFPDPVKRQRVTNAINQINSQITQMVQSRGSNVALFDQVALANSLLSQVDSEGNLLIGSEKISLVVVGDEPHHSTLGDGDHVGTALSGVFSNAVSNLLNSSFGTSIAPFTTQEILSNAGIDVPGNKVGDIDSNGKVDIFDYNILLTNFGKTGPGLQGDLDNNSKIDIFDYNLLLTNFGR